MNEEKQMNATFATEILAILKGDLPTDKKIEALDEFQDYELGQSLLLMTREERRRFFQLFNSAFIAGILSKLDPGDVLPILKEMHIGDAGNLLNEMQGDDLVDLLQAFPTRDERVTYLSLVNLEKRNSIKKMIDYDESLVGSIMNNNYVEIEKTATVKTAIKKLVQVAPKIEFINNLYVTDNQILIGVLSLKEIISAGNQPDRPIDDLMTVNLITVQPTTSKSEAIDIMQNYDFFLLPVVDPSNHMLGIISFDDIAEAIDTESENDYSQLAAVSDINIDEETENVMTTVKKRFPWLAILLFCDLITSGIVAGFEDVLTVIPILALFMPLILNMAGNTGTQSLGIIISLFARNELNEKKSIWKHLLRELFVGIANGFLLGFLLFWMVIVFEVIGGMTFLSALPFAFVISIAIASALAASTLSGALVPLLMKMLKVDPAIASGPFITTIDDIVSLLIYFALAILMLGNLL